MYLKNPIWLQNIISKSELNSDDHIEEINTRLANQPREQDPVISIIIPAKDEEDKILNCIDSLSRNKVLESIEIIVVDNNSTDNTKKLLDKLAIISLDQPLPSIGWARQLGLENAKGSYVLTADADCIYPPYYIDTMIRSLKRNEVVCVTGRYSFIGDNRYSRLAYQFYEGFRDIMCWVRQKKHPYLNAWGGCMGYIKELALELGYDNRSHRGEDGRLCFDLMSKGKVSYVKSLNAKAWTYYPDNEALFSGLLNKLLFGVWSFIGFFKSPKKHDTKTSKNAPDKFTELINSWRKIK